MKTEFRPVFKQEELELCDSKGLAKIICRQERDIHNLHEEIKAILKEWKDTIQLLKK
tara:strand:+ start:277 stop:447 length:171 start_codon:yes stop_codon:yes gene_type:complete